MFEAVQKVLEGNGLITGFVIVGLAMYVAYLISNKLTRGLIHGSAIAIVIGLILAYFGGVYSDGSKGLADVSLFAGIGFRW